MKKLLISILTILGIGLSFCSADGIYHSESLQLISVVSGGNTVYTLQDRNLGATCFDVSNSCSYGLYYQLGNNYGFTNAQYTVNTSTPDLTNYGPGNYFDSNGIYYDFANNTNLNLWGGQDLTDLAMQGPCPNGYHILLDYGPFQTFVNSYFGLSKWSNPWSYFRNYFYFPNAGLKRISGNKTAMDWVGSRAYYRTSKMSSNTYGYYFWFGDSDFGNNYQNSIHRGLSVRCFKNSVVDPDSTRIVLTGDVIPGGCPTCPDQLIDVEYNSGNTSTITCDGINYISINGLSTITNANGNYEYTPYFNISYRDENNQSLIESYDKINLYLSGALFKKTYTDDNEWILTAQGGNNSNFSGYLPTFDVVFTGDSLDTGNIFNNFAENSLKFTLSNIPSYIQYVIIIMLLFFILGFIRKFKRK